MSERETNPWQRLSRRLVYENPWIELYHDEVVRPDGQPGIYGVVHFRHRAIGVVPLDTELDRVLLVGQFRYTLDRYSWEIPEGGGRLDESPEEAARRELAEETGYTGGTWRELCRCDLSNLDHRRNRGVVRGHEPGGGHGRAGGYGTAPAPLGPVRRGHGDDSARRDHRRDDDHGDAAAGPGAGVGA